MRQTRIVLSLSILVLAALACNAVTRAWDPQTVIPAAATIGPDAIAPAETAGVEVTPPPAAATASAEDRPAHASGLGISLDSVRPVIEGTQQFSLVDGMVGGQPAVIASLSSSAATNMPGIPSNFSAAFVGDPDDLGEIRIRSPYSDDKEAVQAGLGLVTLLFASILPNEALFSFIPWISENYSQVEVGGSEELTAGKIKFTLARTQTEMLLDIVPAQ